MPKYVVTIGADTKAVCSMKMVNDDCELSSLDIVIPEYNTRLMDTIYDEVKEQFTSPVDGSIVYQIKAPL